MSSFGVSSTGFSPMRLPDCQADLQAGLTQAFGTQTRTSDETIFGQFAGVFAERYALLWDALGQVYNANTVAGAEGASVDNILALNGITRLPAAATVTNPSLNVQANGLSLPGLVLYGVTGTTVPAGTILQTSSLPTLSFTTDTACVIGAAVNAVQQLVFSAVPTGGAFALTFTAPSGNVLTTPTFSPTSANTQTTIAFAQPPSSNFVLSFAGPLTGQTTAIPYTAQASDVQSAIQGVSPFNTATVTQSGETFTISWATGPLPTLSVSFTGGSVPVTVTQATQALVNGLYDAKSGLYPFNDVTLSFASGSAGTIQFGALTPAPNQPSSGSAQQATVGVTSNTLVAGNTAVNVAISTTTAGSASQATTTATCTTLGPNEVPAGTLTVIGTGLSGLSSVTNPLDCLTGRNIETDTEAMARRTTLLAARGSGALSNIQSSVLALSDVTAALAFANTTNAAQQVLLFSQTPTQGSYQLAYQGVLTASLAYNATANQVQAALQAVQGLGNVLVTGSYLFGFTVDYNGSFGGQGASLLTVTPNNLNATLTPYYGRPPKSVELVVEGGTNLEIAESLFASLPSGIAAYAQPTLRTLGSTTAGSTSVVLQSAQNLTPGETLVGQGIAPGAIVQSVTGNTAVLSQPAVGTSSNVPMTASNAQIITDAAGNAHTISFSRPTAIPLYINVSLLTDTYVTPGNANSGINPSAQFNPASVATIQADLLAAANAVPIGGQILARGTNGLAGSFRSTPGLLDYALTFDFVNPPQNQNNLSLPAEGQVSAQSFNCVVSFQ